MEQPMESGLSPKTSTASVKPGVAMVRGMTQCHVEGMKGPKLDQVGCALWAELISTQGHGRGESRQEATGRRRAWWKSHGMYFNALQVQPPTSPSLPESGWQLWPLCVLLLLLSHTASLAGYLLSTHSHKVIFCSSMDIHHSWDFRVSHPPASTQVFSFSCWLP